MEPKLDSRHLKLYRIEEKTLVAERDKNEETIELLQTITISPKLG
jgi:hypothetical protein